VHPRQHDPTTARFGVTFLQQSAENVSRRRYCCCPRPAIHALLTYVGSTVGSRHAVDTGTSVFFDRVAGCRLHADWDFGSVIVRQLPRAGQATTCESAVSEGVDFTDLSAPDRGLSPQRSAGLCGGRDLWPLRLLPVARRESDPLRRNRGRSWTGLGWRRHGWP